MASAPSFRAFRLSGLSGQSVISFSIATSARQPGGGSRRMPSAFTDGARMAPWVADSVSPSPEFGCGMQNLLRAAAEALAKLAERAHQWADQADDWQAGTDLGEAANDFAGVDF